MNRLCFILSCPQHRLYKGPDGLSREDLVFDNARIGKGIGKILISHEYHNGERGEKFATLWETEDVSAEEFYGHSVMIHNLDDALLSKMNTWNEQNSDNKYTDGIIIDHSLGLNSHVHLPVEQFSRLLQINWKERFLKLTLTTNQSLKGLKLAFSEEGKNAWREGLEDPFEFDHLKIEIANYEIEIEELPNTMTKGAVDSPQFHMLGRLFRFLIGR